MSRGVHVLFLSDTHLGFDEPLRPRSARPHRGPDFFATFHRALEIARTERPDAVVHGGDVFYRSRVPNALVERVMAPLVEVADSGIPVFIVAGNHERSFLPRTLFTLHDRIHVFDEPRTVWLVADGARIAIAGFPCVRRGARELFPRLVAATGLESKPADIRLLCIHQVVEGARVGPSGYVFRAGDDVVRASDLPGNVNAILSGHIHRHQVLRNDLAGRPLPAPVVYSGSTERTSFAEVDETKGVVSLRYGPSAGPTGLTSPNGLAQSIVFRDISARPMYVRALEPGSLPAALARLRSSLEGADVRGVLQVRIPADLTPEFAMVIKAVKKVVPPSMHVSFRLSRDPNALASRPGSEPGVDDEGSLE